MNYHAVTRTGSSDELTHWKYIKKVRGKNGKWRYIYDTTELTKYRDENRESTVDKDGVRTTTTYKDTNDWLDGESRTTHYMTIGGRNSVSTDVEKRRGKLSRNIDNMVAKGEKYV